MGAAAVARRGSGSGQERHRRRGCGQERHRRAARRFCCAQGARSLAVARPRQAHCRMDSKHRNPGGFQRKAALAPSQAAAGTGATTARRHQRRPRESASGEAELQPRPEPRWLLPRPLPLPLPLLRAGMLACQLLHIRHRAGCHFGSRPHFPSRANRALPPPPCGREQFSHPPIPNSIRCHKR